MNVLRIVPNVSSEHFAASRAFYGDLFDVVTSVELDDWYLQLMAIGAPSLNVGFLRPDHELFAGRAPAAGHAMVLTIEVDDVDEAYARAERMDAEIVLPIRDEDYGQRHFVVVDPNGLLLNVMSAI